MVLLRVVDGRPSHGLFLLRPLYDLEGLLDLILDDVLHEPLPLLRLHLSDAVEVEAEKLRNLQNNWVSLVEIVTVNDC